jgi:hypothetical protein
MTGLEKFLHGKQAQTRQGKSYRRVTRMADILLQ